jgi:hypothetical protein
MKPIFVLMLLMLSCIQIKEEPDKRVFTTPTPTVTSSPIPSPTAPPNPIPVPHVMPRD